MNNLAELLIADGREEEATQLQETILKLLETQSDLKVNDPLVVKSSASDQDDVSVSSYKDLQIKIHHHKNKTNESTTPPPPAPADEVKKE